MARLPPAALEYPVTENIIAAIIFGGSLVLTVSITAYMVLTIDARDRRDRR